MRKMLKSLFLTVAVMAVFGVVGNSVAQALPTWTESGAVLAKPTPVQISKVTQNPTLEVPGIANIECTAVELDSATIFGADEDTVESITFKGCIDEGFRNCEVLDNVHNIVGEIHTNPLNSKLRTVGAQVFDFFTPEAGAGAPFVTIVLRNCPIAGTFSVTGTLAALASTAEAEEQSLTASKALSETAGTALKFGSKVAFLKGIVDLKLTTGNKWSIDP
jgi:hypothetical protein